MATSALVTLLAAACASPVALAGQAFFPDGAPLQVSLSAPDHLGTNVALSGDGSTALAGGSASHLGSPLAWPFQRGVSGWAQQGPGVAAGWGTQSEGGFPVALSDDGNTAVVGGIGPPSDFARQVTIAVRQSGTWSTQQILPISTLAVGISGDGSTIITSSYNAVSAWTRTGATWTYQASLSPNDGFGETNFGDGIDISTDGNTVVVGGNHDNVLQGAVWTFRRVAGNWSQSGPKLTVAGANQMGSELALSGSGLSLLVGSIQGWPIHAFIADGAAWRPDGELGEGESSYGRSVALSSDGTMALVGRQYGGVQMFRRSAGAWAASMEPLSAPGASIALSADGTRAVFGDPDASDMAGHNGVGALRPYSLQSAATLTVDLPGGANGGGVSTVGLSCGRFAVACRADYPTGTVLTLTAQPVDGFSFAGWNGACNGSGLCQITMSDDRHVTATFVKAGAVTNTPGPATAAAPNPRGSTLTSAEIRSQLRRGLASSGELVSLRRLRRGSSVTVRLIAPAAGRLRIAWYLAPRKASPKSILIARGSASTTRAGQISVRLRLAKHAKRRLATAQRRLTITARGTFAYASGKQAVATTTFVLRP